MSQFMQFYILYSHVISWVLLIKYLLCSSLDHSIDVWSCTCSSSGSSNNTVVQSTSALLMLLLLFQWQCSKLSALLWPWQYSKYLTVQVHTHVGLVLMVALLCEWRNAQCVLSYKILYPEMMCCKKKQSLTQCYSLVHLNSQSWPANRSLVHQDKL